MLNLNRMTSDARSSGRVTPPFVAERGDDGVRASGWDRPLPVWDEMQPYAL